MISGEHPSNAGLRAQIGFAFYGTLALAFGSALLVPGPIVWLLGGGTTFFVLRIPAVFVHFVGWMLLLTSLKAFPADSLPFHGRLRRRMLAIWIVWFVAALIGIGTLPLVFPELYCTIICVPLGWRLLPYFPFVPSVFAPVVACHAAFLLMESRLLGPPPARIVTRAALILSALAVTSIAIQAAGGFSRWAYLLAGLTAPGYVLAATGLLRAKREAASLIGVASGAAHRSVDL